MIRIAHLGAYDTNIGDNIALYNVRKYVEKDSQFDIEWSKIEIKDFYEKNMDKKYCIERMREISEKHDVLIIGGGGLIQQQKPKYPNRFNLPFYEEVFEVIDIPIMCLSVGFNIFRRVRPYAAHGGQIVVRAQESEEIHPLFVENLLLLIDKSSFFSFRNDGSVNRIMPHFNKYFQMPGAKYRKLPKTMYVTPDPGLIFDVQNERKSTLKKGVLQVAYNGNPDIMSSRFNSNVLNLAMIGEIKEKKNLKAFPHCNKDYRFTLGLQKPGNTLRVDRKTEEAYKTIDKYNKLFYRGTLQEKDYILPEKEFLSNLDYNNFMNILEKYFEYDYSIAMRGHGQMIAMGLNVPHISLSTQPKVYDFGIDNGFKDYTLDVIKDTSENEYFLDKYEEKILSLSDRLCNDEEYLLNWYDKRDEFIKQCKNSFSKMCRLVNQTMEQL